MNFSGEFVADRSWADGVRVIAARRDCGYLLAIVACCAVACEAKGGGSDAAAPDLDAYVAACEAKSVTCVKYLLISGNCSAQAQNAGLPCGEASDPSGCVGYTCESGSCLAHPTDKEGKSCGKGGVCHDGECSETICGAKNDGIQCKSASLSYACVTQTVCSSGQCTAKEFKADGTECSLPTAECLLPPACKNGVCTADIPLPDGTACDLGQPANCKSGACLGGKCSESLDLADGTTCVFSKSECLSDSHCSAGKCKFSTPQNDGLECCGTSICAPKTCKAGICSSAAAAADGTPCGYNPDPCKVNVCAAGTCAPADAVDGADCPTPTDDPCAQSGQCKTGKCVQKTSVAEGKVCAEQTNCAEASVCKAGKCVGKSKAENLPCTPKWPNYCATSSACKQGTCEPVDKKPDGSLCDHDGPKPTECTFSPTCLNGKCVGAVVPVPEGAPCEPDAVCAFGNCPCSQGSVCKAGACVPGSGPLVDMTGRACHGNFGGMNDVLATNCNFGVCDGQWCSPTPNFGANGNACVTVLCSNQEHSQHCKAGDCVPDPCNSPYECMLSITSQCGGCWTYKWDNLPPGKACGGTNGQCMGYCDGDGGCKLYNFYEKTPCDDGDPKTCNDHCCTAGDKGCSPGMCVGN